LGVLRKGEIDLMTMKALRDRYRPCMILTGTVERLETAAPNSLISSPGIAFTARVLDAASGQVQFAWRTEQEANVVPSLFKPRRDHSLGRLCNTIVDELVDALGNFLEAEYDAGQD